MPSHALGLRAASPAVVAASAGGQTALPIAIANARDFRGQIRYSGHRLGDGIGETVEGSLEIANRRWTMDEHSAAVWLHADETSSWLRTGSRTLAFDDPLAVAALANPWAIVLCSMSAAGVQPGPSDVSLASGDGLLLYVDRVSGEMTGAVDRLSPQRLAFSFGHWTTVNGLRVPQSLVRLQGGAQTGAFVVDRYDVGWTPADTTRPSSLNRGFAVPAQLRPNGVALITNPAAASAPFPWRQYGTAFALLLLALLAIAWTRRDALVQRICRTRSEDPRGWRFEGSTPFVTPEGYLLFENRRYKAGAAFYNRLTTIHSSPMFIRISAPGVPHAVVLFRKLDRGRASVPLLARTRRPGFTLVEALVATAVFTIVVVGAVFPMLFVLARADRLADQRQLAVQIASNAMVDEAAALEYGGRIDDGSATFAVDGMDLSIGVAPSSLTGAHDVSVSVRDQDGHVLAKLVTLLGPPVAPPASPPPGSGG
ncbi:MAG: type IV pilus modification PilV family protein [Candidatus Eremiobacter antarcticus]|nr:prepilin-type N-terminal cleavage/methylation domain-containing protein [Candidatus Eremiobacteraeota bacterium]MBC5809142.1 prepilin-type N-terminal cleavage/methylation domain-containing protein [Candidatus Eremiobacteraeota bacterium]